jgi:hypothetical protein
MPNLLPALKIPRTLAQDLFTALQFGVGQGWVSRHDTEYRLHPGTDADWPELARQLAGFGETLFARFGEVQEPRATGLWRFRMAEAEKGVLTLAVEDADGKPGELTIDGD